MSSRTLPDLRYHPPVLVTYPWQGLHKNIYSSVAFSLVTGDAKCPQNCSLATAVVLPHVCAAVTWQVVYISQYCKPDELDVELLWSVLVTDGNTETGSGLQLLGFESNISDLARSSVRYVANADSQHPWVTAASSPCIPLEFVKRIARTERKKVITYSRT
jgi:hypothetical protein